MSKSFCSLLLSIIDVLLHAIVLYCMQSLHIRCKPAITEYVSVVSCLQCAILGPHTYILTYILHTYIHTYMHTWISGIPAYLLHTYIYMHAYTPSKIPDRKLSSCYHHFQLL